MVWNFGKKKRRKIICFFGGFLYDILYGQHSTNFCTILQKVMWTHLPAESSQFSANLLASKAFKTFLFLRLFWRFFSTSSKSKHFENFQKKKKIRLGAQSASDHICSPAGDYCRNEELLYTAGRWARKNSIRNDEKVRLLTLKKAPVLEISAIKFRILRINIAFDG